jgi:hypothetical protein
MFLFWIGSLCAAQLYWLALCGETSAARRCRPSWPSKTFVKASRPFPNPRYTTSNRSISIRTQVWWYSQQTRAETGLSSL